MIYLAIPGVVVAALGALIAAAAGFVATMQDKGRRAVSPRKGTHRAIARAELARLWERLATAELPAPAAPVPAPRRPVNGRYLGTMPRLATTDRAPFTAVDMPACAEPEPGPARSDDIDPAPPVLGFARSLVYGEACQRDVAEAERLKGQMVP